jgi:UDP-N-acetylglucosamine:LPS N-acetylglucosamine transferase
MFDKWQVRFYSKFKPIHFFPENTLAAKPYFIEFASLNLQVLRDGYFTPFIVRRRFNMLSKIIENWKPDIIIGDGHLLAHSLGRRHNLPVVQFTRYAVFPDKPNLIWWKPKSDVLNSPPAIQAFDELYDQLHEQPVREASELLRGDAYLIPGTAELEPIETTRRHLFYGYHINSVWDTRLVQVDKKDRLKKIYITIGGGANRSHLAEYYNFLLSALQNINAQLIVSDPYQHLSSMNIGKDLKNISIFKWIESSTVFPFLNLIIHHGGYSTTCEALWWGIPSIVIPSHTEQEGNGRRLEMLNAGQVLLLSDPPYIPIRYKSYYGRFALLGGFDFSLKQENLIAAVNTILQQDGYQQSATHQGSPLHVNFDLEKIEQFINSTIK